MINIVKAENTSDLSGIIRLIYETDNYIYPSMCNFDYKLFETIMQELLFTDSIFSYKNMLLAEDNGKTIGLLLYFEKIVKLPQTIEHYMEIDKEKAEDFNNVIQEYFTPLLSKIDKDCIYINNLCVDTKNRKRGIGAKLIEYLIKIFSERKITLDCLEDNTAAVNFYLKSGFKIIERFGGYAGKQEGQINCIKLEYYKC